MSAKTGKLVKCALCGKEVWRKGKELKRGTKNFFCSRKHKGEFKTELLKSNVSKQSLEKLYTIDCCSFREIEEALGIVPRSVSKLLKIYDIPIRRGSDAIKAQWIDNQPRKDAQAIRFAHNIAPTTIPTNSEAALMRILKALGVAFHFQYPVFRYIIDFAVLSTKTAIELDDNSHSRNKKKNNDGERDKWLQQHGWRVVRISRDELSKEVVHDRLFNQ